jgi:hypothetical protein
MQKITQEFDAEISNFEKKVKSMSSSVTALSKKAKISFSISGITKIQKDFSSINGTLTKIKNLKFTSLENSVTKLTPKLNLLNVELKETAKHLRSISNSSANSAQGLSNLISNINSLNTRLSALNANLANTNNRTTTFGGSLNTGSGFIDSMFHSVQRLLPFLSALFVVNTVIQFAKALFEVNRQYELFELKAKSALYGSKLAVDEYYSALQRIDIKSLFDITELEEGLVKLLNRRILLTEEELQSLADTAEAVGTKGAQSFNQIVDALLDATVGQFKRLEELGVGVDATGKKLKLTFAGTTTEVDKGTEAIKQYILGMNKMNGASELSAKTANTLEGKLSSLKTQFDNLIRKIGEMGATNAFGSLLDGGSKVLSMFDQMLTGAERIVNFFNQNKHVFYGTVGAIGGGLAAGPAGAIVGYGLGEVYSRGTDFVNNRKDPLNQETAIKGKEYERIVNKMVSVNNELLQRGKGVNPSGNVFFNPSALQTESLKNYVTELEIYIKTAKQLGVAEDTGFAGKEYKRTIERLGLIKNEIQARTGTGENDDAKKQRLLDKQNRFNEQWNDVVNSASETRKKALEDLVEQEKKIEIDGMKERLRFLSENSTEYLKLKEQIAIKEIELERTNRRNLTKELLTKSTEFAYVNKAGKPDKGYIVPSEMEVSKAFFEENEMFNARVLSEQNLTKKAIEDISSNLKITQKDTFDKISEFIESSQDREKRAIVSKYNTIHNEIDKLRKTGLNPMNEAIIAGVEAQIYALEKLEMKLVDLNNAQAGSVERSRSSVIKKPNESKSSYNRRIEIAGLEQSVENASEKLNFLDFSKKINPNLADSPTFLLMVDNAKKALENASNDLQESVNKQKISVSFKDGLISKIFGLDETDTNFLNQVNAIKDVFSQALDVYSNYINSLISLEKKREDEADKNIQKLQSRLEKEDELKRAGLANNYSAIQEDIKRQESLKERAVKKQNDLQKLQIASNAAIQISNLVTAISSVVKQGAEFGPAAPVVIALNIAAILGVASSAIAQSKALTAEEGGILNGARHYNGGINVNAEDGEGFIRRPSSIPNKRLVLNLNNIKKKVTSDNLHELLDGTGVSVPSDGNEWKGYVKTYNSLHLKHINDNSRLETRLEKIEDIMSVVSKNTSRIPEKQYVPLKEGKVLVIDGENTKIINA